MGHQCSYVAPTDDIPTYFFKMDQSWPLFVYFGYFLDTISIIQIEKSIDGVLGNPGPQDGRRRRNHGAMAATLHSNIFGYKNQAFNQININKATLF